MVPLVSGEDARVVAVREALAPYAWRTLTAEAVCRRALAAIDSVPAGGWNDEHDERMDALVQFLGRCPWRSLTVGGLSRQLVTAVEVWRQERAWFDIQLGLLLDGTG